MTFDLPDDYLLIELGPLRIACPPDSPLATAILELGRTGRLSEFIDAVRGHADAGRATGRGRCHEVTMSFLNAAGPLDVRPVWARTPGGNWHCWIEYRDEALDVVLTEDGAPLVVVQPVEEFCAMRGIVVARLLVRPDDPR